MDLDGWPYDQASICKGLRLTFLVWIVPLLYYYILPIMCCLSFDLKRVLHLLWFGPTLCLYLVIMDYHFQVVNTVLFYYAQCIVLDKDYNVVLMEVSISIWPLSLVRVWALNILLIHPIFIIMILLHTGHLLY